MTTLESVGTTLGLGSVVTVLSLFGFGFAIRRRSPLIAPRAVARPRNVIYNPQPTSSVQDRRDRLSPTFGWVRWALELSYDQMLQGVPGTGTRDGGLSGSMLKVNMDGIVLLRFHSLCLRVCCVATFLCIGLLLPLYYTAKCHGNEGEIAACSPDTYNVTNYERTTISNVPAATRQSRSSGVNDGLLARLYMTAICFATIVLSTLHFLRREWVEILAMRRVYYLEKDIWAERRNELKNSLFYDEAVKETEAKRQHFSFEEAHQQQQQQQQQQSGVPAMNTIKRAPMDIEKSIGRREYLENRDPWIPHPEQRDTVPNVALYSLLVGGLPSLPFEAMDDLDAEAAIDHSKRQSMDWQLSLTAAFFDHCVPNQPGFSSSVAAVTIIPGANDMTLAWRKWYAAASKLRRLRFIRRQITERRHYEIESERDDEIIVEEEDFYTASQFRETKGADSSTNNNDDDSGVATTEVPYPQEGVVPTPSSADDPQSPATTPTPRPIYSNLVKRKSYFRKVLGSNVVSETDEHVYEAVSFGPEQASVYSREFAQAAAPCCPNGCREGRVLEARIDELLEMEKEAAEEVHLANLELNEVRRKITFMTDEGASSTESARQGVASFSKLTELSAAKVAQSDLDFEARLTEKVKSEKHVTSSTGKGKPAPMPSYGNNTKSLSCETGSERPAWSSLTRMEGSRDLVSPDWKHVQSIVNSRTAQTFRGTQSTHDSEISSAGIQSGTWDLKVPSLSSLKSAVVDGAVAAQKWIAKQSVVAVESVARESTYAIVTFTSRQAAVAARNCLADGRGGERWLSVRHIPTPPLADAPPCDIKACRNCLRPVTMSITNRQKNFRLIVAIALLFCIYVFYTVPLAFAQGLVSPQNLDAIFPGLLNQYKSQISGLLGAGVYSLFFSSCPIMFKAISNFGSGACSAAQAEFRALQYYWWFMLFTAFSSNLLVSMTISAINNGLQFGAEFRTLIITVANQVPSTAFTWLNWIILRFTVTLPLNYLLTINSFLFACLRLPCCQRAVMGGGPGGPTPYRIYVDSGVVLLCTIALAPASPLVAPAALFYFMVCTPLWRRNLIFMYRPKFDTGGARWIFLFDLIISCIITGIVLITALLALKSAIGPAIIAALPMIPTFLYQSYAEKRLKPAYNDAALLQTSLLDGWDTTSGESSVEDREEFRRFLVDSHKAAYVPVCIAGPGLDGFVTAEPAVALPLDAEVEPAEELETKQDTAAKDPPLEEPKLQHGATLRRAMATNIALLRMRKAAASLRTVSEGMGEDDDVLPQLSSNISSDKAE